MGSNEQNRRGGSEGFVSLQDTLLPSRVHTVYVFLSISGCQSSGSSVRVWCWDIAQSFPAIISIICPCVCMSCPMECLDDDSRTEEENGSRTHYDDDDDIPL